MTLLYLLPRYLATAIGKGCARGAASFCTFRLMDGGPHSMEASLAAGALMWGAAMHVSPYYPVLRPCLQPLWANAKQKAGDVSLQVSHLS
jgi:hypothetical protein